MSAPDWEKFRIKVVCFLLAVLIWLIMHQVIQHDRGFELPSL